jgi:hypothetical protein
MAGRKKLIPPFQLVPKPLDEAAKRLPKFRWASKEVGTRHQLGGKPDWIQDDETPDCELCEKPMTFYGQLDSINDDFIIGDCGMLYVFYCFDCMEAQVVVQCA